MDELPIHIISGDFLLKLLRRVQEGEGADDVYMEVYANSKPIRGKEKDDDV